MKPQYDNSTLKALRKSIKHWWENWSGAKPFSKTNHACALCRKFNTAKHDRFTACVGCPVRDRTGFRLCQKSPYLDTSHRNLEANKAELDFLINIYEQATDSKLIYTQTKPPRKQPQTNTEPALSRPSEPKPLLENSSSEKN